MQSAAAGQPQTVEQALLEEDRAAAARRSRRHWLIGGAALAAVAPAVWYFGSRPLVAPGSAGVNSNASMGAAPKGVGPQTDFEAPNFSLKDPAGKMVELKQLRGKPVLLNFWATWCVPCREEMPELERLYRENKSKGLVVLAVSVDESRAAKDIPDFLKLGEESVGSYTFPVALDEKQDVLKQYKLLGVPQSFFIDPAGVIRMVQPRAMNRQTMLDGLGLILPGALASSAGPGASSGSGGAAAPAR